MTHSLLSSFLRLFSETRKEADKPPQRSWSRAKSTRVVQRFDGSSKFSSNFPHCGDCRREDRRTEVRRGVARMTTLITGTSDNETKNYLSLQRPDVCVSDWPTRFIHIASLFLFFSLFPRTPKSIHVIFFFHTCFVKSVIISRR